MNQRPGHEVQAGRLTRGLSSGGTAQSGRLGNVSSTSGGLNTSARLPRGGNWGESSPHDSLPTDTTCRAGCWPGESRFSQSKGRVSASVSSRIRYLTVTTSDWLGLKSQLVMYRPL